ncbi:Sodium/myo-inositol cotransporter 2, partial [Armadillidium nasatum]
MHEREKVGMYKRESMEILKIVKSSRRKNRSIGDYFLASKNMHWILVGSSLFASNIGSGHFIGLAGSAASSGIGVAGFELIAAFALMELGWLFVPVYFSSDVFTMPEYLRERFGGQRIRIYLAFLSLLLYIFTKISADLYAGALFIQIALNRTSTQWLYISIFILLAVAAIFTITGGLTAVLWTDFIQTILMIIGSLILMGFSFVKIGGFRNMFYGNNKSRKWFLWCPTVGLYEFTSLPCPRGLRFTLDWNDNLYAYKLNVVIVQRSLASKNLTHAKAGCVLASFLKLLPLWLIVFPGMVARILFPDTVACADPEECMKICGSPVGCTNMAYAELVINLLPKGLCGLMLAVMMAALMSSLTSIFNSSSTIFTIDIWTRFRKNASDLELVIVGRIFVIVLVIISIVWIPIIQNSGNSRLFDYVNSISSFLAPPVCAVYLLAVFWPRANEQ